MQENIVTTKMIHKSHLLSKLTLCEENSISSYEQTQSEVECMRVAYSSNCFNF